MVKLKQAIVVEGRYDVNTLRQLVDAPIFETRGFGIMNDRERLALLRAAARRRGLIILTDSDGAGFVIRNFLKKRAARRKYPTGVYPGYLRQGKAQVRARKRRQARRRGHDAGGFIAGPSERRRGTGRRKRLRILRAGHEGRPLYPSAQRTRGQRLAPQDFAKELGLPEHLSANALLQAINLLFTRSEFLAQYKIDHDCQAE